MKTNIKLFKPVLSLLCGVLATIISNRAVGATTYSICELAPFPGCGGAANAAGFSFGHGMNALHNQSIEPGSGNSGIRLAVGSASGGVFCDPRAFNSMEGRCPAGLYSIASPSFHTYCSYSIKNGRTVGVRQVGDACASVFHAFRSPSSAPGAQDLQTLGGDNSVAYGVSDQGHVVGTSQVSNGTGEKFHAFLLHSAAFLSASCDMGTLGNGDNSIAFGINDVVINAGINKVRVIGASETLATTPPTLLWPADTYHLKAYLPFNKTLSGNFHAFAHDGPGVLTAADDLATLGGANSVAYAISRNNLIVGTSQDAQGKFRAFLHNGLGQLNSASYVNGGDNIDNGVFLSSVAYGVKDLPQVEVVGMAEVSPNVFHAFLWLSEANYGLPAGMTDLSDAFASSNVGSDWTALVQATGIRYAGNEGSQAVIVGTGIKNGQYRGFILTVKEQ